MFLLHFLICFIILSFIYMKISQTGDQRLEEADSRSRRQKKRVRRRGLVFMKILFHNFS